MFDLGNVRFNQQNTPPSNLLVNISQPVSLLGQKRNEVVKRVCWRLFYKRYEANATGLGPVDEADDS